MQQRDILGAARWLAMGGHGSTRQTNASERATPALFCASQTHNPAWTRRRRPTAPTLACCRALSAAEEPRPQWLPARPAASRGAPRRPLASQVRERRESEGPSPHLHPRHTRCFGPARLHRASGAPGRRLQGRTGAQGGVLGLPKLVVWAPAHSGSAPPRFRAPGLAMSRREGAAAAARNTHLTHAATTFCTPGAPPAGRTRRRQLRATPSIRSSLEEEFKKQCLGRTNGTSSSSNQERLKVRPGASRTAAACNISSRQAPSYRRALHLPLLAGQTVHRHSFCPACRT